MFTFIQRTDSDRPDCSTRERVEQQIEMLEMRRDWISAKLSLLSGFLMDESFQGEAIIALVKQQRLLIQEDQQLEQNLHQLQFNL